MKKSDKIDALEKLKAFVKSDGFGTEKGYDGLCLIINSGIEITITQRVYLRSLIPMKRPFADGFYCWKVGERTPRIRFINKKLKELDNG